MRSRQKFTACLLAALFLVGCTKTTSTSGAPSPPLTTLQRLQKAESDIAIGVSGALSVIETLHAAGAVTNTLAAALANDLGKVTTVNNQLIQITSQISQLAPAQQTQIQNLIPPVISALQSDITNGTLAIKDPKSQATAQAALAALVTVLQVVLQIAGG